VYLRSTAIALVGLIQQDVAVLVEYPLRLSARVDDLEELVKESRCLKFELPRCIRGYRASPPCPRASAEASASYMVATMP
jgi:hypothetical protein